jgi:hypothetical protein
MIPGYPQRFIDLFATRGDSAIVVDGIIYRRYGTMVVPFGPAHVGYSLSGSDSSAAMKRLGGMLVRTTGGFGSSDQAGGWYAVICRRFTDVGEIPSSNTRSKLRRALRNCTVRRLTARELARWGHAVYVGAHERYRGASADMSPSTFQAHALATEGFDDIVHHWGVFCDGDLAGYSSNYVLGTAEASYATLKFHPAYLKRYTSYALLYEMNRYYLDDQQFAYVNDGFRSILHETDLQDFLERTFGFEKAYTSVDVTYRAPVGALVKATFPARRALGRVDQRLRALYELERIVREDRHRVAAGRSEPSPTVAGPLPASGSALDGSRAGGQPHEAGQDPEAVGEVEAGEAPR